MIAWHKNDALLNSRPSERQKPQTVGAEWGFLEDSLLDVETVFVMYQKIALIPYQIKFPPFKQSIKTLLAVPFLGFMLTFVCVFIIRCCGFGIEISKPAITGKL